MQNKLIVILGQTASGKTDLSIRLAKEFSGQIVSADSRQVYKGLDIGSGKITKKEMSDINHYLIDVANPKRKFSVSQYQKLAKNAIKKIQAENKIPFLVGGTGFYIQSIVDDLVIPAVAPNWKLRKSLESKSNDQLFLMLKKLDPNRARNIDPKNPRRLVRAIEIVRATKKPVPVLHSGNLKDLKILPNKTLQIGIKKSPEELKKLIYKRLKKRIKGIIAEVKKLKSSGLSWKRMEELGLEYRFVAQYVQGLVPHNQMEDILQKEIEHYAKRQMTWFKRDKRIIWIKNYLEAKKIIKSFL